MTEEQAIQEALVRKFPKLEGKVRIQRERRIFTEIPYAEFDLFVEFASGELGFTVLNTITGVDDGATLGAIYHLARPKGITLNVKTSVPKDAPVIRTLTGRFACAEIYEREITDLLGFKVDGLKPGKRYPLPDDWPAGEYPLRKDWKSNRSAQAKGGEAI